MAKLYKVDWFPGIKLAKWEDQDDLVKVEVYEVDNDTLLELDYYEGHPHLFTRIEAVLWEPTDTVFIYEYNGPVKAEEQIPSGDWLKQ